MRIQINYLLKGLTIVAFILIATGMLAAWNTPMRGYELSAFTVTPPIYWISFAFGLITVFLILSAELLGKPVQKYLRIIKWILLAVCILSLTMLLLSRGMYGMNFNGDGGAHIGNLKQFLREGTFTSIYPNLYYYTITFQLLTSLDIINVVNIIPAISVFIFIIGVFFATREIFQSTRIATVSACIACALPFGTANDYTGCAPLPTYIPYVQGLLVLSPFLIYAVYSIVNNRKPKHAYFSLVCILLISTVFYHILVSAILLLFTISVCLGLYLQKKYRGKDVRININLLLVATGSAIIAWIIWTIYLQYMKIPVSSIYSALTGDSGTVYSEKLNYNIENTANYDFASLLDFAVKQFGITGVIFLILFISLIIAYIGYRKGKRNLNILPFIIMAFPLVGIAGFSLLSSMSFQPGRIAIFITIIGILFSGFVIINLLDCVTKKQIHSRNPNKKRTGRRILYGFVIVGIVISLFVLGAQTYYPGTEVYSSLSDNTKSDVSGMQFYFENGDLGYEYNVLTDYIPSRWDKLIYGSDHKSITNYVSPLFRDSIMSMDYTSAGLIRPNYNYKNIASIKEGIRTPGYLMIGINFLKYSANQADRKLRADSPYWVDKDTMHLKYDDTAHSIYNNGALNLYIVP